MHDQTAAPSDAETIFCKDVFEEVNFAVAFDQLLNRPAEFFVLPRRNMAERRKRQIHQRQFGIARQRI